MCPNISWMKNLIMALDARVLMLGICFTIWTINCEESSQKVSCFPYTVIRKRVDIDEIRKKVKSFQESGNYITFYSASYDPPKLFSAELRSMCGKRPISSSIVSGTVTVPNAWPWQAFLFIHYSNRRMFCGGTLISSQWVVTAAHCFGPRLRGVRVFLGLHHLHGPSPNRVEFFTPKKDIHIHPEFEMEPRWKADICLIKLPRPVYPTQYVRPACLAETAIHVPKTCLTMGWGYTFNASTQSPSLLLKQISLRVEDSDCKKTPDFYCAWTLESKRSGSCRGDSGGPLLCKNGDAYFVHGIVSHGSGTCDQRIGMRPSFYTNITHNILWIRTVVGAYPRGYRSPLVVSSTSTSRENSSFSTTPDLT